MRMVLGVSVLALVISVTSLLVAVLALTDEVSTISAPALQPESTDVPLPTATPVTAGNMLRPYLATQTAKDRRYSHIYSFIEDYLTESGDLPVECFDRAGKTVNSFNTVIPGGTWWSVKATTTEYARTEWDCPRFHFYEVYDWTGEVKRTDGS